MLKKYYNILNENNAHETWVLKDMRSAYFGEWGFKRDERVTSHSEAHRLYGPPIDQKQTMLKILNRKSQQI